MDEYLKSESEDEDGVLEGDWSAPAPEVEEKPESSLCVECGERPYNPKYSRMKLCGVCMAKRRKKKPGPKPKDPGNGEIKSHRKPKTDSPGSSELTTPEEQVPAVAVVTIHLQSLEAADEFVELLERHKLPHRVTVTITIGEGRA